MFLEMPLKEKPTDSSDQPAKCAYSGETRIHYFDAIVDGNDVTNAKPDPEVFLIAAKLLDVNPENAIVFEDSAGVQAANIGKMTSIGIGNHFI
jgi:beta-phosphoglucomutase-like phosphatase (HAD superfamily)